MRTPFVYLLAAALLAGATDLALQRQIRSFDQAWELVRDRHWDPKLNGLDWDAVKAELRPRVERAQTADEARAAIQELVNRLGKSHFAVIPAEAFQAMEPGGSGEAVAGIDFRILDGLAVVTAVAGESPAAQAGVRPGWILRRIASTPFSELLERAARGADSRGRLSLRQHFAVVSRLQGEAGASLPLVFEDEVGRDREVDLRLRASRERIVRFGNLPAIRLRAEADVLPGPIGYLQLSAFFDPAFVQEKLGALISRCRDCRGIVLDLRGNFGGLVIMSGAVSGWFLDKPATLGTCTLRDSTLKLTVFPRPQPFTGKLAILVDGLSMSTSEILAGGLQDLGRARIFGEKTAGAALPSQVEKLPSGDALQFATANYVSAGGRELEGAGVNPDTLVRPTRAALLAGRDLALEAAAGWIRKEN